MKKKYFVSKSNYNNEVIYVDYEKLKGYRFSPKDNLNYDGIKVNEMMIIKPSLIEKIIKRKIKNRLELYMNFILEQMDSEDEESSRIALDDLSRYRYLVKNKYSFYLDEKYLNLLDKKFNFIEKQLNENIPVLENRRSR